MAILQRIRAALDPRVTIEDLQGEDTFTPVKDLGEALGASYGIETPRARRRREELEADRQLELGAIDGRIGSELERLASMDPENADHSAIVGELADRADIVSRMIRSQFPEMREAGFAELSALMENIHSVGLEVEKRSIRDAELEAAGLTEEWNMMNTVADDLSRESGAFLDQRSAFGRVLASAENPSAAGDLALIFNYMKILDPGSTVREGEFATAQNAAGIEDRVRALYNNLLTGERMLPDQRSDFVNRSRALYGAARTEQIERNSRYLDRARAGGVRESLLANLAIPLDPGETEYLPPAVRDRQEEGAPRSVSELPKGTERLDSGLVSEAITATFRGFKETAADVARGIAGIELYRAPDGFLYERDPDGNITRVGRENRYIAPDGRELELVDRGNGRYEWRAVGESGTIERRGRGTVRGVIQRQRPTN